jgi:hypothetical protein
MKKNFVKLVAVWIAFVFSASDTHGQRVNNAGYEAGHILLPDSTKTVGLIKVAGSRRSDIYFKKTVNEKAVRYRPSELSGYSVDTLKYISLLNVPVFGSQVTFGKVTVEKELFGLVKAEGKIKVFQVVAYGYDPLTESKSFVNYIFQKQVGDSLASIPFPLLVPLSKKRYQKAVDDLSAFFTGYPQIQDFLKTWKRPTSHDGIEQYDKLIALVKDIH